MSPRKLSDTDRVEIIDLYRTSEETTSTLAIRYGVSSSTISRFLKNNLSESEYEDLIQEKRLARTSNSIFNSPQEFLENEEDKEEISDLEAKIDNEDYVEQNYLPIFSSEANKKPTLIRLKSDPEAQKTIDEIPQNTQKESLMEGIKKNIDKPQPKITFMTTEKNNDKLQDDELEEEYKPMIYLDQKDDLNSINLLQEMFGEDIDEDDEDDEDWDEDWDEDDDFDSQEIHLNQIQVLPISEASFPRICYLVIDHNSDLITRPLKDFADLGNIPSEEVLQKTLPVFDNHRVAKRFSNRRGKVIKVPNGNILQKTSDYLSAKGITRLFMDGKIYSL